LTLCHTCLCSFHLQGDAAEEAGGEEGAGDDDEEGGGGEEVDFRSEGLNEDAAAEEEEEGGEEDAEPEVCDRYNDMLLAANGHCWKMFRHHREQGQGGQSSVWDALLVQAQRQGSSWGSSMPDTISGVVCVDEGGH
jgi:hypothetical protein